MHFRLLFAGFFLLASTAHAAGTCPSVHGCNSCTYNAATYQWECTHFDCPNQTPPTPEDVCKNRVMHHAHQGIKLHDRIPKTPYNTQQFREHLTYQWEQ